VLQQQQSATPSAQSFTAGTATGLGSADVGPAATANVFGQNAAGREPPSTPELAETPVTKQQTRSLFPSSRKTLAQELGLPGAGVAPAGVAPAGAVGTEGVGATTASHAAQSSTGAVTAGTATAGTTTSFGAGGLGLGPSGLGRSDSLSSALSPEGREALLLQSQNPGFVAPSRGPSASATGGTAGGQTSAHTGQHSGGVSLATPFLPSDLHRGMPGLPAQVVVDAAGAVHATLLQFQRQHGMPGAPSATGVVAVPAAGGLLGDHVPSVASIAAAIAATSGIPFDGAASGGPASEAQTLPPGQPLRSHRGRSRSQAAAAACSAAALLQHA